MALYFGYLNSLASVKKPYFTSIIRILIELLVTVLTKSFYSIRTGKPTNTSTPEVYLEPYQTSMTEIL